MSTARQELLDHFAQMQRRDDANRTLRDELVYRGDDYLPPIDEHLANPFSRPHDVRERYFASEYGNLPTIDSTAPPAGRDEFWFGLCVGAAAAMVVALIACEFGIIGR